jgi:cytochrome P450
VNDTHPPRPADGPPPSSRCPAHPQVAPVYNDQMQDPPGLYRRLRQEHGPVAPILLDGDVPAWLVLGYRELHRVTSDTSLFSHDSRHWHAWEHIPADWPLIPFVGYRPTMLMSDGEEHRRRSDAVRYALESVDPFELNLQCERVADELIDAFAGSGQADLMAGYADQVPLRVMTRLFGLDKAESEALRRDVTLVGSGVSESYAAMQRVEERMAALVRRARKSPGPSIPGRLVAHAAALTDEEAVSDLNGVVYAGNQATTDWIGNALWLMLTDERFETHLAGGRRSVGQALNEVLWEEPPGPAFIGRWAIQDTVLGGQRIRRGDCLVLGLGAANADPKVRVGFDAGMSGNQAHMAFGSGEHMCPNSAQEMAQAMAGTAIEVLLDRLPDITLSASPEQIPWRSSILQRGVVTMPVAFTPAPLR